MIRRLRAWWNAPLFTMPHLPEPRGIPWKWITYITDPDCPPNAMYGMSADTYDRLKKSLAELPAITKYAPPFPGYSPRDILIQKYGELIVSERNRSARFTAVTES